MCWPNPPLLVLTAACLMASCASSPPPAPAPPVPQPKAWPAALMLACEAPAMPANNSCDEVTMTLKTLYDQYGDCAGRLIELQDEATGPRGASHE
jgi:hypothetical protein